MASASGFLDGGGQVGLSKDGPPIPLWYHPVRHIVGEVGKSRPARDLCSSAAVPRLIYIALSGRFVDDTTSTVRNR